MKLALYSTLSALLALPAVMSAAPPPSAAPSTPAAQPAWHGHAQWQGHRNWRGRNVRALRRARRDVIDHRLDLTAQQKTSLRNLHRKTAASIRAVWSDSSLTAQQKRAKVQPLRKSEREQMKALLTEKQRAEFARITRHPRMFHLLVQRHLRMALLARHLDLTAQQRSRIRGIAAKTGAAIKPIRENSNLTAQQKRTAVHQLMARSRTEIKAVLTPEQQTKLARIRRHLLAPLGPLS